MRENFDEMMTKYVPKFAEKVELKLPTLKKLPTLTKVEE
jgi:hypothetical protein